jgi:hypothetical protein
LIIVIFLASMGCTSFHALSREEVMNLPVDKTLIVNTDNRLEYAVTEFRVKGDSLMGRWNETFVGFDLSRVESMGLGKIHPVRTVIFCGLLVVGATLIISRFNKSASGGAGENRPDPGGPGDNE